MPEKLDSCVEQVRKQQLSSKSDKAASSAAYAICSKSTGYKKTGAHSWTKRKSKDKQSKEPVEESHDYHAFGECFKKRRKYKDKKSDAWQECLDLPEFSAMKNTIIGDNMNLNESTLSKLNILEEFFNRNKQTYEFLEIKDNNLREYARAIEAGKKNLPEYRDNDVGDFIGAHILFLDNRMVAAFEWQLSHSHNYFECFNESLTKDILTAFPAIVDYVRKTGENDTEVYLPEKSNQGLSKNSVKQMLPSGTKILSVARYANTIAVLIP